MRPIVPLTGTLLALLLSACSSSGDRPPAAPTPTPQSTRPAPSVVASATSTATPTETSVATPTATPRGLIGFAFSATVTDVLGVADVRLVAGDTITGTFTFDPASRDASDLNPNQGYYPQHAPTGVAISLGDRDFRADVTSFPAYAIEIENDEMSLPTVRDRLRWVAGDPSLAGALAFDNLQAIFTLDDPSAVAFSNDTLPTELDSAAFSGLLFVNGVQIEEDLADFVWTVRAVVDSIDPFSP